MERTLSRRRWSALGEGDARADICIVGGGFCGLWTALRLKERDPSLDIAIVEKDECGSGASGRNGGFVLSWWAKFGSLCKFCPSDEAARLARASADAVGEIGRFCAENGIDAHYRGDGWLWAASSEAQTGSWDALVDTLARHQLHPFELWEPETVKQRSGTDRHVAGVYEPTGATVQPALLARGLRRVALARGVRIYERTPMMSLHRSRPPQVVTPRGIADRREGGHRHERLVHHAAGAAAHHPRDLERYRGDPADAGPPRRLRLGGRDVHLGFPHLVNYYRPTMDGRVAFGTGGGRLSFGNRVDERFNGASPRAREVERYFRHIYPNFGGRADRDELDRAHRPLLERAPLLRPARRARRPALRLSASPATAWGRPRWARASSPRSRWGIRTSGPSAGWCGTTWGSSRASRCATSAGAW